MKAIKVLLALTIAVLMLFSLTACLIDLDDTKEITGTNGENSDQSSNNGGSGSIGTNGENSSQGGNNGGSEITSNNGETSSQGGNNGGSGNKQKVTIGETVCFDYNGFKVTAKEIVDDSIWGAGIKLYIENNSSKDYSLSTKAVIVNNCMVSSFTGCKVPAGKKANETLYLSSSDLEAAGITNIGQIEIYFYLYDPNSYDSVYTADRVTIKTSAFGSMDATPDESGYVLYDQGGIKIIGKYVDESTFWGSSVLLYVQNSTGKHIGISCEDMSINGFMVSGFYHADIYDGKYSLDDITILSSDLTQNGITSIDEIELKFHIYDADSYQTIADTDPIKFSAK